VHSSRGFCGCSLFHDDFFLSPMEKLAKHFDKYKVILPRNAKAHALLEQKDLWTYQKSTYVGLSERRMYERALQRHPSISRAA
jgi:hypothetical protein